jgi:hypothetical protein
MQGWMTSLNYDEQSRIIVLTDVPHVRLLQKNNEVLCPEITVVLDEEKKQIERVECRGSGQLYQYARGTEQNAPASKKRRELSATWQRLLKKAPAPEAGLDLIELEGRAELKRIGQMSLEADVIGIWVTRGTGRIDRANARRANDLEEDAIQPKKLLALKNVRFASPQIGGRTESLAVWFKEGQLPPIPVIEARKLSQLTRSPEPVFKAFESETEPASDFQPQPGRLIVRGPSPEGETERMQVYLPKKREPAPTVRQSLAAIDDSRVSPRTAKQPTKRTPGSGSGEAIQNRPRSKNGSSNAAVKTAQNPRVRPIDPPADEATAAPPVKQRDKPLDVVAEQIQVLAMRDGDQTEIAEVVTEGRVHVQQDHSNGELPLDVTGDKLLLWNYGDTNQILQVYGKPAQVQDRKLQLEGPDIRFDRIANRALVTGAGVLRAPVPNGMDGKPLPEPQMLDVFWKEKMDFDGKIARFFANVRSQLNGSDMRCEEMQVTFNRRVSFADEAPREQDTKIQSVLCRDGVDLKTYEYEGNRLVSVGTAHGFEFKLNQLTGRVTSQGPGTLESWRLDRGRHDAQRPGKRVDNMRAREVDATEWKYTRIDFDGSMRGSTKDQTTTFRDVKCVIYGSVTSSTETIDEEHLPKDGGRMRCRELTLTQVPATKDVKAHLELKATGNVALEGNSFSALAHQVTYDESKDQYIISGDGAQNATIFRESETGGRRNSKSAQHMQFIPSQNRLSFDRVSGGEANR